MARQVRGQFFLKIVRRVDSSIVICDLAVDDDLDRAGWLVAQLAKGIAELSERRRQRLCIRRRHWQDDLEPSALSVFFVQSRSFLISI